MPVAYIGDDGKIIVPTQYHERHLVQQVPGARYDKAAGYWTVPLSWASCIILRGLFKEQFEAGPSLTTWSWETYNSRIEPAMRLRNAMTLPHEDPISYAIDAVESQEETREAA